jgi:RNA polymerase sigma factor (sigma-70 family)
MPTDRFDTFLRHLHRTALRREGGSITDGQLLERFIRLRDEAAFEALVRQHGAMVHGVCRRVLRNWHDAEDAFQATFLVLARKASSIRPRDRVGNFLYGVAYRTALEARRSAARRRLKEAGAVPRLEEPAEGPWAELRPLLDRELAGLPEKYRAPLVLCDLEGKSRREAARQLGWREGTLSGRLARARVLLARRLRRYGVAVAGGALAALLGREATAAVAPALVTSTVRAAVLTAAGQAADVPAAVLTLVQGVHRAMWLGKLNVVVLGLVTAGVLGGVGFLSYPGRGTAQVPAERPAPPAPAAPAAEPRTMPRGRTLAPYTVEPSDCLRIQIIDSADLPVGWKRECIVRPDGTLSLGDLGTVFVTGKTLGEVRDAIVRVLRERVPTGPLTDEQIREQVRVEVTAYGDRQPSVVERQTRQSRQYWLQCMVVQAADDGKDFGKDGKGKVLALPRLTVEEAHEGFIQIGGQVPVAAEKEGKVEYIPIGITARIKVRGSTGGKLRLEAVLERSEVERSGESGTRIRGVNVRSVDWVKLGEPVKLVLEKDDHGQPRLWARIEVIREEEVLTRSREVPREPLPASPARIGQIIIIGNENVKQDVILREVSLAPGQVLSYPDLLAAERALERLGLFRVDAVRGIRPTVRVVESSDPALKDIVITVEEKPAANPPTRK